ncbi:MAG: hypothetical protein K9I36_07245 [Bacteroidia bacterium]|nr:hypothetical protein [Bacteroidia bacterium]MCF8426510.1 hypothetical protein [Bacteroidia bacterium]
MKNLLVFAGVFLLMVWFGSCRKTYTDPDVSCVVNPSPVIKGKLELDVTGFFPLADNSFIISVIPTLGSFEKKVVYLHYDENFNFIDSTIFLHNWQVKNKYFGKGVQINNSIFNVYSRILYDSPPEYFIIETDFNYKIKDQSSNIQNTLNNSGLSVNARPQIIQLANGNLVTATSTYSSSGQNSLVLNSVYLVAFGKDIHGAPLWKNDSVYTLGNIQGKKLVDMASDGNFFYVLCGNSSNQSDNAVLRKHDENGNLIWISEVPINYGHQILVQEDKIILFGQGYGMQIYDKQGALIKNTGITDYNLLSDGSQGFLGLNIWKSQDNPLIYKNAVLKYNSDFTDYKLRFYGDNVNPYNVLGRLIDGSYVLVTSINGPGFGEQFVFYKLDADLNDYTK